MFSDSEKADPFSHFMLLASAAIAVILVVHRLKAGRTAIPHILSRAIWEENAWGAYWSWDPKETWVHVTWIVYTLYLHARFGKKWRGTVTAAISTAGFVFTLFTFHGVGLFLSGLHSCG